MSKLTDLFRQIKIFEKSAFKWRYWVFAVAFLATIYFLHAFYFSERAGYRSQSADIFNHYFVVESILHADIFPDWDKPETAKHAVSNYLPLYHGLIGSHLLAASLVLMGLPLPGSVLMLSDLALLFLLLILVSIVFKQTESRLHRWLPCLLAVTAVSYIYIVQNYGAFFSQTVGLIFGAGALFLLYAKAPAKYVLLPLFLGVFCYPDSILFLLPVVFLGLIQQKKNLFALCLVIFWATLCFVFASRFKLPGSNNFDLSAVAVLFVTCLFSRFFYADSKASGVQLTKMICWWFLLVFAIMTAVSVYQVGGVCYYLNKFSAWSYVLLPLVLSQFIDWKRQVLVLFLFGLFFSSEIFNYGESKSVLIQFFCEENSVNLNNSAWREIRELFEGVRAVKSRAVVPWISNNENVGIQQPMEALLAIAMGYNLTSGEVNSNILRNINAGVLKETKSLHMANQIVDAGGLPVREKLIGELKMFPNEVLVFGRSSMINKLSLDSELSKKETKNFILVWKN